MEIGKRLLFRLMLVALYAIGIITFTLLFAGGRGGGKVTFIY